MVILLLSLSIVLSTGRNILSKKLSDLRFGTKPFFWCQSVLFLGGAVALLLFGGIPKSGISLYTWIYALIYGILLILAQWFYTAALAVGNTALCSTVYSMGFILPTLSGAIFWSESLRVAGVIGVLCAVSAVVVSGIGKKSSTSANRGMGYLAPLIIAMLASGGLGIIQKLQQRSPYAEQRSAFLLIAFLIATGSSLLFALVSRTPSPSIRMRKVSLVVAACVGLFFGCCNLLNTYLAGKLDSAFVFPTLNIGVILLSMGCGMLLFKERFRKKDLAVLLLGIASILLLTVF